MSGTTVAFLQIRDDADERTLEARSFLRASGLAEDDVRFWNTLAGEFPDTVVALRALVVGGSSYSVFPPDEPPGLPRMMELVREAARAGTPFLGLCFGGQLLAQALGGQVVRDEENQERGSYLLKKESGAANDPLFETLPQTFFAQESHHDRIMKLPPGGVALASSEGISVQAFVITGTPLYGFQFHPERSKADFESLLRKRKTDHGKWGKLIAPLRESPEAESIPHVFFDKIAPVS
jgi:GMP synthase (glutamine-hydrolysing)